MSHFLHPFIPGYIFKFFKKMLYAEKVFVVCSLPRAGGKKGEGRGISALCNPHTYTRSIPYRLCWKDTEKDSGCGQYCLTLEEKPRQW